MNYDALCQLFTKSVSMYNKYLFKKIKILLVNCGEIEVMSHNCI